MHLMWDQGDRMPQGNQAMVFRFAGKSGQQIYLDFGGPSFQAGWTLYDSSGRSMGGGNIANDGALILPSDGVYYLILDGNALEPVVYGLRATVVGVHETQLVMGRNTAGKISNPGDEAGYFFDGVQGQRVVLDWLEPSGTPIRVTLSAPTMGDLAVFGPSDSGVLMKPSTR